MFSSFTFLNVIVIISLLLPVVVRADQSRERATKEELLELLPIEEIWTTPHYDRDGEIKTPPSSSDLYKYIFHESFPNVHRLSYYREEIMSSENRGVNFGLAGLLSTIELSKAIFSAEPEFYGMADTLEKIREGSSNTDLFGMSSISLQLPLDLQASAILEYKKIFKKVFLETYHAKPFIREFFRELGKALEAPIGNSGAPRAQTSRPDPWIINRLAGDTAQRRVPDYRLDPVALQHEYDRAFLQAELFWQDNLELEARRSHIGMPVLGSVGDSDSSRLGEILMLGYINELTADDNDMWLMTYSEAPGAEESDGIPAITMTPYKRLSELSDLTQVEIIEANDVVELDFKMNSYRADVTYPNGYQDKTELFVDSHKAVRHPELDTNQTYFLSAKNKLAYDGCLFNAPYSIQKKTGFSSHVLEKVQSSSMWRSDIESTVGTHVHHAVPSILKALDFRLEPGTYIGKVLSELIANLDSPEKLADALSDVYLEHSIRENYENSLLSVRNGLSPEFMIRLIAEPWGSDYFKLRDEQALQEGKPHISEFVDSSFYRKYKEYSYSGIFMDAEGRDLIQESRDRTRRAGLSSNIESTGYSREETDQMQQSLLDSSQTNFNHQYDSGERMGVEGEGVNLFEILDFEQDSVPSRLDHKAEFDDEDLTEWIRGDESFERSNDFFKIQSVSSLSIVEGRSPIPVPRGYSLTRLEVFDQRTNKKLEFGVDYQVKTSEEGRFTWIQMNQKASGFFGNFFGLNSSIEGVRITAGYNKSGVLAVGTDDIFDPRIDMEKLEQMLPLLNEAGFNTFADILRKQISYRLPLTVRSLGRLFSISSLYVKNYQSSPAQEASHGLNPFMRFSPMLTGGQFCGLCYTGNEFGEELLNQLFSDDDQVKFEILKTHIISKDTEFITDPGHAELRMKADGKTRLIVDFTPSGEELNLPHGVRVQDFIALQAEERAVLNRERVAARLMSQSVRLLGSDAMRELVGPSDINNRNNTHPVVESYRLSVYLSKVLYSNDFTIPVPRLLQAFFNQNSAFTEGSLILGLERQKSLINSLLSPATDFAYREGERIQGELSIALNILNYLESNLNIFSPEEGFTQPLEPELKQLGRSESVMAGSCSSLL